RLKGLSTDAKVHPKPCPEVFDKLSIHADGSVVLCCNDYNGTVELGNVADTPIIEMWQHPKIEAYRKRLAENNYEAPLCRDCYDYLGLTEGEVGNGTSKAYA
ncbi:MAG: SPASM domain-containing protein, partial [Planctomycetota bacterium]